MRLRRGQRSGFTLMEVLLASAIGLIVLTGVYMAIDTQMKFAEQGRNLIEEATLARSLAARMTSDLTPCVGQPDPTRYQSSKTSSSTTSTTSTTTKTTTGTTPPTSTSNSSSGTGMSSDAFGDSSDLVRAFVGDDTTLRVFVSRVPRSFTTNTNASTNANPGGLNANQIDSDQKLVTYWIAGMGGSGRPLGLARYEESLSTATTDGLPSVVGSADEARYVIAPEVVRLQFRYYDGISWETEWDGRVLGDDYKTPLGPPKAISIEFDLESKGLRGEKDRVRKFRHVIAIPTANGTAQTSSDQPLTEQP